MNYAAILLLLALGASALRVAGTWSSRAKALAVVTGTLVIGAVWCASTLVGYRLLGLLAEVNARFTLFLQIATGVLLLVVPARALVESQRGDERFRRHVRHVGAACVLFALLLAVHAVAHPETFRAMGLTPLVRAIAGR